MGTPRKQLIDAVEKIRKEREMSDRQFSLKVLGISPSYYCLLKNGERRITLEVLQILKQRLPEITPEVIIFFMSQGDDGKNKKGGLKTGGKTAGV